MGPRRRAQRERSRRRSPVSPLGIAHPAVGAARRRRRLPHLPDRQARDRAAPARQGRSGRVDDRTRRGRSRGRGRRAADRDRRPAPAGPARAPPPRAATSGAAIDDAYAALLRKLEGNGVVRVEPTAPTATTCATSGASCRRCGRACRRWSADVEGVQFGGERADREPLPLGDDRRASGCSASGSPAALPSHRRRVGLAALARRAAASIAISWDHSPSGRAGVVDLLQRYGFDAARAPGRRCPSSTRPCRRWCCCPTPRVDEADWAAIANWTGAGRHADRRRRRPRRCPTGSASQIVSDTAAPATTSKHAAPPPTSSRCRRPTGRGPRGAGQPPAAPAAPVPSGHQATSPPAADERDGDEEHPPPAAILVRGKSLYAVERTYEGGGRAIVLADDRLLTNASLLVDDNARLMVELLRTGRPKLELAGELTGLVSPEPATSRCSAAGSRPRCCSCRC